jgi:predicted membrane chloride channel (bestrophin family)
MKRIIYFFQLMNLQALIVTILAVASTFVCHYYGIEADIPSGLIGLAVVFPIVFSINSAYKRREEALGYFSGVKAHAVALYYAHRDWIPGAGSQESGHAARVRQILEDLLASIRDSLLPTGRSQASFHAVYRVFSRMSGSLEQVRKANVPANEISRANQYLSKIMIDFEKMRNIARYRTPVSLRAYSTVFLSLFPIAFGPYFAMLSTKSETFPGVGYLVAVLYSLVLVLLDNIQDDLEDPFDGVGTDDVHLDVAEDFHPLIAE